VTFRNFRIGLILGEELRATEFFDLSIICNKPMIDTGNRASEIFEPIGPLGERMRIFGNSFTGFLTLNRIHDFWNQSSLWDVGGGRS